MSDDSVIDAIETFKLDAASLSNAQLALITKADADLGRRAREKRAAVRDAERRHEYARLGLDWQQLKGMSASEQLGTVVAAAILKEREAVATRFATLEARVLELEATQAARSELVP